MNSVSHNGRFEVLKLTYVTCLIIHTVLMIFFLYNKVYTVGIWNILSVLLYVYGTVCISKTDSRINWVYAFYVEVIVNVVLCNIFVGLGYGFSFYCIMLIPITFYFIYNENDSRRSIVLSYVLASVAGLVVVIVSIFGMGHNKLDTISDYTMNIAYIVNFIVSLFALIYMTGIFLNLVDVKTYHLKEKNMELDYRASYDMLTKMYNRAAFFEKSAVLIKNNPGRQYLVIFSDIKDFKLVNDLFGVEYGDEILIAQADIIKHVSDERCVIGRFGGDQFVMCVPKEHFNKEAIVKSIEKMQRMFSKKNYHLHIYIGVYEVGDVNEPINQMCDKAMMAVAKIKGDMHKNIGFYDKGMLDREYQRQNLISEFEAALDRKQFKMYLQPQTDKDGRMLGAEALVRWEHPEKGLVMPDRFIGALEQAGLIYKLDMYIWNEAARILGEWEDAGFGDYYISVNISAKDFYYIDVYKTIDDIVKHHGIEKENLHLEITETALTVEAEETQSAIRRLHDDGYILEIDDFGSGYSSLKFLKDTCTDVIKIDREFLQETANTERSKEILRAIIGLSNDIDMYVISEGVEVIEQVEMLTDMGCNIFQGYYFSKPIPVIEFEEKYNIN